MKTRLFDENDRWTQKAMDLDTEIRAVIAPIILKFIDEGYSPRDIEYVASQTAHDIVILEMLK